MQQKFVVTLSGPSGAGKTILEESLITNKIAERVMGFTTRSPRTGEVDGKDVHFIDKQQGKQLMADGQLVQSLFHSDNIYGKRLVDFEEAFDKSNVVTCVMPPSGVKQVSRHFVSHPDVTLLSYFVTASTTLLTERMLTRLVEQEIPDTKYYAKRIRNLLSEELNWEKQYRYTRILTSANNADLRKNTQTIKDEVTRLNCAYL